MTVFFTSELNRLAHRVKKLLGLSWGESLKIALKVIPFLGGPLSSRTSVFMSWKHENIGAIAGHFWGLAKAYEEVGDKGRSFAFKKISTRLYSYRDNLEYVDLRILANQKRVGSSVINEIIDFWIASHLDGYTPRSKELLPQAPIYSQLVEKSEWTY